MMMAPSVRRSPAPAAFSCSTTPTICVEGHHQVVGRGQRVHREHAQRRRAVDEHRLVGAGIDQRRERRAQPAQVVFALREFGLHRGEVDLRGDEREALGGGRDDHVRRRRLAVQHGIERAPRRLLQPERAGRVRLRVEVDDERGDAQPGKARAEVNRGGGLADPALLVRDGEDLGHVRRP
jgi:hypothetical protein